MRGNNKVQSKVMLRVKIPTLMIKAIAGRTNNVSVIVSNSMVNIDSNGQTNSVIVKDGDGISVLETGV